MEGFDALKISHDKKQYIVESLNPVLEEMVADAIHKMPSDPVQFMLEWLESKEAAAKDAALSQQERDQLAKDNAELEEKVDKLKGQMQSAAKLAHDDVDKKDEEEEEEDDDEEPPEGFFDRPQTNKMRTSVSAEAYGEWNTKQAFTPPVIQKSDEQKARLKDCLCKSFLFSSLEGADMNSVVGAMKEVVAEPQQRVINQGENGDFLFVIESGNLDCIIKTAEGTEKVVKTCQVGDVFGELALLYNCPRAASVECKDKCVLWQLDRDTFNHIVKDAAQKKRDRYDAFLAKVPLLSNMDAYERSQLADAIKPEAFDAGADIMKEGEMGAKFYIIEDGAAAALKGDTEVMQYKPGDYFGELALIRNQPRAATVKCKTDVKVLSIDSASFKRLLNVNDLLERTKQYT